MSQPTTHSPDEFKGLSALLKGFEQTLVFHTAKVKKCKYCGADFVGYAIDVAHLPIPNPAWIIDYFNFFCDKDHFVVLSQSPNPPKMNKNPDAVVLRYFDENL